MSEMERPRCPFYSFHWPSRGSNLFYSGGGECGLDLSHHGPCRMALERRPVDFDRCDLGRGLAHMLEAGRHHIRFHSPGLPSDGMPLEAWRDQVMRRF
ncbi:MAG: hypothetical protein LAP40_20650 [Acidobacteriia bacterium]|nr:hypothetical protein [Terriglobia bacterium]